MSGAFAALRGFRRRWADPEPGPESALAAALQPENALLSVTPDSASRSNGSFCLVEPEGASVTSSSPMGLLPAFDIVGQQPCNSSLLGQSVLRRPPLHGREWAPQRVDGVVPVAVEPCFRPVLQYRPLRGPLFPSQCSLMARVEQPLPPPVYRGADFYDRGPRFRIDLQTAQVSASSCSARSASTLSPLVPACIPPQILQGAPVVSSEKVGGLGVRPRLASSASGPTVVTSASAHSANWRKVLGVWSELVSRHATCSPHFAGALGDSAFANAFKNGRYNVASLLTVSHVVFRHDGHYAFASFGLTSGQCDGYSALFAGGVRRSVGGTD